MPFEAAPKSNFQPAEEENVYRAETNTIVSAPSGLNAREIAYSDDIQNNGHKKENYFGFAKIGNPVDLAAGYIKGIVHSGVSVGTFDLPYREKKLQALQKKQSLGENVSEEIQATQNRIRDIKIIRSQEDSVVKGMGLEREQSILGDVGQGAQSLAQTVGLTMVTGNPVLASVVFGSQTKSDDYQEARSKGKSIEISDTASTQTALSSGMIEAIGTNALFKAWGESNILKRAFKGLVEQSLEEGSQELSSILIKNNFDITNTNFNEGAGQVAYAAFIGGLVGAPVSAVIKTHPEEFKEQYGVEPEEGLKISEKIEAKVAENPELENDLIEATREVFAEEESPLTDNQENEAKVAKIMQDFEDGNPIDLSVLNEAERLVVESAVGKGQAVIDAQEGRGLLPVPKRPQTLSEFLKEKGGIKSDTEEAQRFTRKETPGLKGVANKNGKLSLDEARELAVEAGFLKDTPYEGGVAVSTEQDLLDALESEADGYPVVLDQTAMNERDQVLEYNEQLAEAHTELLSTSKQVKSFRAAFKEGVRAAKKDVKSAQTVLIKALNNAKLRPEDKAKFIAQIKNIQTGKQLEKAAPDIQQRVSDLLTADSKRVLRKKIKDRISTAKKSKKVSADTIENIKRLEKALSETGVLGKGFKDTDIKEFKSALDEANVILSEGKIKLLIAQEQKKERQAQRLEELAAENNPLVNREKIEEGLGLDETLSVVDHAKNLYIEGMNKVQRVGMNKNPMDVIFDVMSGFKNYQGAFSRVFKNTIDKSHNGYLNLKENTTREVKDLHDKLKLTPQNYRRIGAYAAAQQESGVDKLKAAGITQEEIDNLVLEPEELEMYDLMRSKLDSLVPALKEVMLTVYNKEFKGVKDYFPFMTDFKSMTSAEIQNMFAEDAPLIGDTEEDFKRKNVDKKFTKHRTGGKQKIKIDAFDIFLNHVDNATYLIEMGQDIKELGELALEQDFKDIAGDFGQEIVVDWIDLLARKGKQPPDILDTFRKNIGAATLGFKLSSALIQPTALMDGAAFVGGDYVSRGVAATATNPEWRSFLKNNFPEIRERVGDDPAYLDMGGKGIVNKAQDAGFWAIKNLDLMAASAVASGAYIKSVEQRGGEVDLTNPDPIAIEAAQLAVRRTQSSAFAKDAAPLISQGKLTGNLPLDKLIFQFQSFMFNRWSLIEHDMLNAGIKQGKTAEAMNIATWLVLANITERFVRHGSKFLIAAGVAAAMGKAMPEWEDEDDEDPLWKEALMQGLSNVPFVSTAVSVFNYGSIPVPSVSIMASGYDSLKWANRSKATDKKIKHYTNAALMGIGAPLGFPGAMQTKQLINEATKKDNK